MPDLMGNATLDDVISAINNNTTSMNAGNPSAATALADSAAKNAYYNSLASGQSANQALEQAKFEWQKKLDEAAQTGMWNGIWNNPQQQWFTTQFGNWLGQGGEPTTGQQTLSAQQQQWQQAYNLSQAYGQYLAPGGPTPYQGYQSAQAQQQATDLAAQQAQLTGWYTPARQANVNPNDFWAQDKGMQDAYIQYNQNDPQQAAMSWARDASAGLNQFYNANPDYGRTQTLAGQQQQWSQGFQQQQFEANQRQLAQQNTLAYLQQLASLRGPADWAKYQQVLGSTPQGMRDLYAAAMGQYVPGGGATTGVAPTPVDLSTMQQQIAGYGTNTGMAGYNPQAQASGGQVWGSGIGVGGNQMTPDQQMQATGNGTNLYGGQQQQYNLPAPNQISAQAWNNFTPSQKQMMLGMYESQGWNKDDVTALYNQALPQYGSNNATAGTWRMTG